MKLSIFNIHDVALFITITLCLLLAMFQLSYPHKNRITQYFLVIFLLDIAMGVGSVLLFWQPAIKIHPIIDNYIIPYFLFGSILLKGPLLYGYVYSITTPDYRLKPVDFIHLIPALVYFLLLAVADRSTGPVYVQLLEGDKFTRVLSRHEWHTVKIIPLVYAVMAVHKLHLHNTFYKNQYPGSATYGPTWVDILAWGAMFNWGWSLGVHLLGVYLGAGFADSLGILDNYITSGLIGTLFIYSLVYTNKQLSANIDSHGLSYQKNSESLIVEKIIHCMETEKLFLNPRLNIERMAEHMKIPYREVSALINKHFHANFNEYINLYRINEAKKLLSDSQLLNVPINEIYVKAGFNSKSAFHRFFNRLVGVSPSEFRKLSVASTKTDSTATV
jgi:AraC-like DNA-binding protein